MSEDHLANKSQPPSALSDAEFDVIYATVAETAQGRRFLEEYARRSKPTDTEATLAAIERMQASMRGEDAAGRFDLLLEMADMAQVISQLRAEIASIKPPPGTGPQEAREELDTIVDMTESATSRILAAAEQMQEIAWTLRESGAIESLCDLLDSQATEIYTACSFQDLTGQRTRKVIRVLRYLEERINATVVPREKDMANAPELGFAPDSMLQDAVDAMMQSEAFAKEAAHEKRREERQDATLEDISRLMFELEPTMVIPSAAAEEPIEQVGANIEPAPVGEDVRPELFVAERVIAESEHALKMAEWAIKPPVTEADEAEHADLVPAPPVPAPPATAAVVRPAAPSPSVLAKPELFVAESIVQLERTLRPAPLLPPPELTFRTKWATGNRLAQLHTKIAPPEMQLSRPVRAPEDEALFAPEPEAESQPEVHRLSEIAELMKRSAATLAEPYVLNVALPLEDIANEEAFDPAEPDPDDFLFAAETAEQPAALADVIEPVPQVLTEAAPQETQREAQQEIREEPEQETQPQAQDETERPETVAAVETVEVPPAQPASTPETDWKSGTRSNFALVAPRAAEEPKAEAAQPAESPSPASDPLAPIRAMSDAQKIALFS